MNTNCFKCGNNLELGTVVSREEECPDCGSDARVCLNCIHYDKSSYNDCKESNAERIVEKDRRNFCDYFKAGANNLISTNNESKADLLKNLDDLFKK